MYKITFYKIKIEIKLKFCVLGWRGLEKIIYYYNIIYYKKNNFNIKSNLL